MGHEVCRCRQRVGIEVLYEEGDSVYACNEQIE